MSLQPIPATGSGAFWRIIRRMSRGRAASLHDMIQPSFSFLVGVALPYSIASADCEGRNVRQDVRARPLAIVAADCCSGSFCDRCTVRRRTSRLKIRLSQIGLGYPFLFLLGSVRPRWQWIALGVILSGIGWRGRCIRWRAPDSIIRPSACLRTGSITTPASWRTGTRTAIWAARSTSGS